MKAKKVLLGLLVVGLVVVGLSGVVWGDVAGGTGNSPSASLNPSVSWTVPKWIVLYIPTGDMTVRLTDMTVASLTQAPTTDTVVYYIGETDKHEVYAVTNNGGGLTVKVSAAAGTGSPSLDRFEIKGGSLSDWTALSNQQTLITTSSSGVGFADNIQYRYGLISTEAPNKEQVVNLTYTATTQ